MSQPNHDFNRKNAFNRAFFSFIKPVSTSHGFKILNDLFLTIERSNPLKRQNQTIHEKIMAWSSQEWKSGNREHYRPRQPDKNSWDSLGKIDPHRGEHLLGKTAHSATNEKTIHERTTLFRKIHRKQ